MLFSSFVLAIANCALQYNLSALSFSLSALSVSPRSPSIGIERHIFSPKKSLPLSFFLSLLLHPSQKAIKLYRVHDGKSVFIKFSLANHSTSVPTKWFLAFYRQINFFRLPLFSVREKRGVFFFICICVTSLHSDANVPVNFNINSTLYLNKSVELYRHPGKKAKWVQNNKKIKVNKCVEILWP